MHIIKKEKREKTNEEFPII